MKLLTQAVLTLLLASAAVAQTLSGTVTNGTTSKPGAGDDVVLISLGNGMQEVARTKADAGGKFSFQLKEQGPHLIRAIHQGVTYHKMAPPGTDTVEVQVYDAATRLDAISVTADVMRVQAQSGQLDITRLFAVNNKSNPPRTLQNDHNFEFFLPDGAKVNQGMAKAPNGQPINSDPVPQKEKNKYAFGFPLRPGETQFQVSFQLPYSGEASIDPKPLYAADHFVVLLPKSMQFTPGPGTTFQSMQDPQNPDGMVQVAQSTTAGQNLSYKVSGNGLLASENTGGTAPAGGAMGGPGQDGRPGGGLGPPIDAPDPLQQYRLPILIGFALALAIGAFVVVKRQRNMALASGGAVAIEPESYTLPQPAPPPRVRSEARPVTTPAAAAPRVASASSGILLEALKEEIFQLEVERKQGKISSEDYEKARAALDHTLERALKRG